MLASDIATRVKRQFGDEQGVVIQDADIIRWINDAMREIVINNDLLQVQATTGTTAGEGQYSLPSNIMRFRGVTYKGHKLTATNLEDSSGVSETNTGTPTHFWQYAGVLNLYPTPDTDGTTDLKVFYTRMPTEITALTDTPELPVEYHNRIVEYCIGQAAELDENLNLRDRKLADFRKGIDELKDTEEWTERDVYPSISVSSADYGSGYDTNNWA